MADRKFLSSVEALGLDEPASRGSQAGQMPRAPRMAPPPDGTEKAMLLWGSSILRSLAAADDRGKPFSALLSDLEAQANRFDFDEVNAALKELEGRGLVSRLGAHVALSPRGRDLV
jgi:hypothetical protein